MHPASRRPTFAWTWSGIDGARIVSAADVVAELAGGTPYFTS